MRYALLALPLALAACATAPKDIRATYVAEPHYSCADRATLAASLEQLSREQRSRRNADLASFALFGLTPSMVSSGGHRKQRIAQAKGELAALDKECGR